MALPLMISVHVDLHIQRGSDAEASRVQLVCHARTGNGEGRGGS